MSEYENSLQNCQVVKDGVSINAADECKRLAEENRRMRKHCQAIGLRFAKVWLLAEELNNYINPRIKPDK